MKFFPARFYIVLFYTLQFSSAKNATWAVSFASIEPRFDICISTVSSWIKQIIKPSYIVISVTPHWDPGRVERGPTWVNSSISSDAELLRKKLFDKFPQEVKQGSIVVIEIPKDHGPATKIVGVLSYFSLFPVDYWVIGDDDLIYRDDLLKRYDEEYTKNPPKPDTGPVYTHFNSGFLLFSLNISGFNLNVPQLQGADTYSIPTSVLVRQSRRALPLSYAQYLPMLEYMFATCPDSYYNDDFLISYTLAIARINMISIADTIMYSINDKDHSSEIHLTALNSKRRAETLSCLKKENDAIMKMWRIKFRFKQSLRG